MKNLSTEMRSRLRTNVRRVVNAEFRVVYFEKVLATIGEIDWEVDRAMGNPERMVQEVLRDELLFGLFYR